MVDNRRIMTDGRWLYYKLTNEPKGLGELKIVGKSNFSEQFRKLINSYKRIGYNPYVMQQTACLVITPTSVDSYASLFNCTTAGRASDSMTAST